MQLNWVLELKEWAFLFRTSIMVLVDTYLTVCTNDSLYIVCNEELIKVWLSKTTVDHSAQNGMRVQQAIDSFLSNFK